MQRAAPLAAAALCLLAVATAFALQAALGLEPCPLCILQRAALLALALGCLAAAAVAPRHPRLAAGAVIAPAVLGGAMALEHLRIALAGDGAAGCAAQPATSALADWLGATLGSVFLASGQCADVDRLLGVPYPGWALLVLVAVPVLVCPLLARD
ncbi:disulfide bond formation protein B [Natronocella acetinitrilica]|nr:disulfide bond formation protein B [Natronocella acetinitrilica]